MVMGAYIFIYLYHICYYVFDKIRAKTVFYKMDFNYLCITITKQPKQPP